MVALDKLLEFTTHLLEPDKFHDYAPNGLQVQGCTEIKRIATGVTACKALLDEAIQRNAQAILVHHGYFWKGESPIVVGIKRERLAVLLAHDINLIAYHLPLDAHPEVGNNAQLGQRLGWTASGYFGPGANSLGVFSNLSEATDPNTVAAQLRTVLARTPQVIAASQRPIRRIGWCTGAAQSYIESAVDAGLDAYISGEISEQTVHVAREANIHYFAAGHHATERYGVQALGQRIARQFDIESDFVDIDNPV